MATTKDRAEAIIKGRQTDDTDALRVLVKDLKAEFEYGLARGVIQKARATLPETEREWFLQQLALCTYKDDGLIPVERYQGALKILDEIRLTAPSASRESSETLALRGAIHKRIYEHAGQTEHLYRAVRFYLEAWTSDPAADMGYGGVNAAYAMDLLGSVEKDALEVKDEWTLQSWTARAKALRLEMRQRLPGLAAQHDAKRPGGPSLTESYWYRATLAEVHWGLEEWEDAGRWLEMARDAGPSGWELQSTAKQLVSLGRLHGVRIPADGSPPAQWHAAWRALERLVGGDTRGVLSAHRGKVGLALSGGGFRAALFHLGVLARLAEMDVLRSIEVLSTVSGGSIVGAHYYLALRNLLQTRPDEEITPAHYVALVREVLEQFLAAIQNNLRTRGLSSLAGNAKFVLPGSYTRSNRMGELYEEFIYAKVQDGHPPGTPRRLRDILIHPAARAQDGTLRKDTGFKPNASNWRRRAKVPVLLLNTTSLNTGHNWHFTARSMGEPPGLLGPESETLPRYRRLWYEEAPTEALKQYRLGYAVAASACVPALFEPLELRDLYPDRTVRLVDGGVHDNQGVAGLLDESCTWLLCSDASGQMTDKPEPSNSVLGVPLRSNSILMDRVRETEYLDLRARTENRALQGLFFIHLKQELVAEAVTWIKGAEKPATPPLSDVTSYGVARDLQGKLAAIRTDLDSFSDVEAYALMASGYLMTEAEFRKLNEQETAKGSTTWGDYDVSAPRGDWRFLGLAPILELGEKSPDPRRHDLARQLDAASSRFFKAFKLVTWLRVLGFACLAAIAAGVAWLVYANWDRLLFESLSVGELLLAVLAIAAGFVWPIVRLANPEGVMRSWVLRLGAAVVGWVGTNFHLLAIDPIFLKRGKLERLLRLTDRRP